LNFLLADLEFDVKKQNYCLANNDTFEDVTLISSDYDGQRHFETLFQQIGDGPHPAVEYDVASFCQSLVFKIENIGGRNLAPEDHVHQFQAASFREDQEGAPVQGPAEILPHGD